jgi:hypothetical protein
MHMFGLEGSGLIIALGVTLLVSGAIIYYCNSRIAALEKALVQQNQVLSDFIVNMRTSIEKQSIMQQIPIVNDNNVSTDHATDTALEAAKAYYSDTVPDNKIEVSEDNESEEDSDEEDDLESESEVESDEDSDIEGEVLQQIVIGCDTEAIQQCVFGSNSQVSNFEIEEVNLESSETHQEQQNQQNEQKVVELTDGGFDLSSEPVTKVQEVIKLGDVESLEEIEKTTNGSLSDASSLSSHDEDEDDASTVLSAKLAVTDLKKIKVTQLKEMAVSAGKIPAEAKKMKKAQLIEFLEAKRAELQ